MSFLAIEGLHAFVTGAQGGIGSAIVKELVAAGCKVTAHDLRPPPPSPPKEEEKEEKEKPQTLPPPIFHLQGDISSETSISHSIEQAISHFGPINILCVNAGITNEQSHSYIWDMSLETWEDVYRVNVRGSFLTVKYFLRAAIAAQEEKGDKKEKEGGKEKELQNLAIVVTGSECGKFGQAGHVEYASGKAGLQYGLVPTVKNEIVKINSRGRINAVAPGWVNTELIGDRLDDARELYWEAQGTAALKKIAQPEDVARTVVFLASHRASGHISGQCISVDGGMEGRVLWREEEVKGTKAWGHKADPPVP